MSDGLQMFLLLVLAPFVVGIAMLLVTRRIKGDWARIGVGLVGTCSLLVLMVPVHPRRALTEAVDQRPANGNAIAAGMRRSS